MAANSQFAVATHILLALASLPDTFRTSNGLVCSEAIALSVNTNAVVIRRIVADLVRAGLVVSHPGKGGGLELSRPASKISLLDVYRALGDPPVFAFKANAPAAQCPVGSKVTDVLTPVFDEVQQSVRERLGQTTLADLVHQIG